MSSDGAPPVAELSGGRGSPLLLLHGLTGSARIWAPVLAPLRRHHAVLAPTLPGHCGGEPLVPGVPATVDALVDALERRLDALGMERVHVVGNSLGGWMALELARRGRARSVTAFSPAGAWRTERDVRRLVRLIRGGNRAITRLLGPLTRAVARPGARRLILRQVAEHGERIPAGDAAALLSDAAGCTILDAFLNATADHGALPPMTAPPDCPVRIAWAACDRTIGFRRYGAPLLEAVAGAELEMLPGVGHVPIYDDPDLVVRTILQTTRAAETAESDQGDRVPAMTATATQDSFPGVQGRIALFTWPNPDARYVALLAHGYGEHTGRYDHVAERLIADGAVVYSPDHLGHGHSEGERALVADIDQPVADLHTVADRARSEHPGLPMVLIGHSMGGLIAARFAQLHGGELSALVLSGPVVGGNPQMFALLDMDPIPDVPLDPAMLSRDPAVGQAYAQDPLVYHGPFRRETLQAFKDSVAAVTAGPSLGALPTLWIHGENDPLAPLDATRPVMEGHLKGSDFDAKVYAGAMHEIFNETNRDEVLGDVVAFLDRALGTP